MNIVKVFTMTFAGMCVLCSVTLANELSASKAKVEALLKQSSHKSFNAYLGNLKNELASQTSPSKKKVLILKEKVDNAAVLHKSIVSGAINANASFISYSVPALSAVKRLPYTLPKDGELSNEINVIAAKGEFEPCSTVLFPFTTYKDVKLVMSDLKSGANVIPASKVDIRVVKCWFQGGTAWHSYFTDPDRRSLTPELLLHDEKLLRVDLDTEDNYLRIDYPQGSEYLWASYPSTLKGTMNVFNHDKEPVADSESIKPIDLISGESKQLWITLNIPVKSIEGTYKGTIDMIANGKSIGSISINLRVLPFVLPEPKTYYDLKKTFISTIYHHSEIKTKLEMFEDDREAAEKKVVAELKNLKDHNIFYPQVTRYSHSDNGVSSRRQLELLKELGFKTERIYGLLTVYTWEVLWRYIQKGLKYPEGKMNAYKENTKIELDTAKDVLGHKNVYGIAWDEPGSKTVEAQKGLFEVIHSMGAKVYATGKDTHFRYGGFNEDVLNYPGSYKAESARKWHTMGAQIISYANPHTGPENPSMVRRSHGLKLYKADYDGTGNYRYYAYRLNIWNDFESPNYRINFVYPTSKGIIDTLHWEGFREGIDDVRYATKLRQVAEEAIADGEVTKRYAGKMALQYLALVDEDNVDQDAARLEMIHHILKIQSLLKGDK